MTDDPLGSVRHSDWLLIDQSMVDRFADVTFDRQFIHVDPARAAESRFGGTIAHGFLTLSLLTRLYEAAYGPPQDQLVGVNYGFDRVRFLHPVHVGSRIRGVFSLAAVEEKHPRQFQQTHNVVVEIEGVEKPALIATWISQIFT